MQPGRTRKTTTTTRRDSAAAATPSPWIETALALIVATAVAAGCKSKKDEVEQIPPPASEGRATRDQINTKIGLGLAIDAAAPSNTRWDDVFVIDDATAVVAGRADDQAIALLTRDKGRSFHLFRADADEWHRWGVGESGDLVLITGPHRPATGGRPARPVDHAIVRLTSTVGDLSEPAPLFGSDEPAKELRLESSHARPAVLGREVAAIVVEKSRQQHLVYGVLGGTAQPAPVRLPPGRFAAAPYGRPPQLLSLQGASLEVRPWPKPGEPLAARGTAITGIAANPALVGELSAGPGCDVGPWSFQRVGTGPAAFMVGVSPNRSVAFRLPPNTRTSFGCSQDAVVVAATTPKKEPQLIRCTLDGQCAEPQNVPFEAWPDEPISRFWMAPTEGGLVALMSARKGARWGVYLATSTDGGRTFELPRSLGEGESERGTIEVGALIAFGDRMVLLLSADVTGTNRRGWYVLHSTDAGSTWGVP